MGRRELTGAQLAQEIDLSATSISRILTGHAKPRQLTLTRLMKRLCTNADEEQMMVRAFTGLPDILPDSPDKPTLPSPADEVERVTRYMEVKAMSVAFEDDVETVIIDAGLAYKKDFRVDPFICDFLLTLGKRAVALDCKYNVNRDWDRTVTTIALLRKNLPCDLVAVVVPYENDLCRERALEIKKAGGRIIPLPELKRALETHLA